MEFKLVKLAWNKSINNKYSLALLVYLMCNIIDIIVKKTFKKCKIDNRCQKKMSLNRNLKSVKTSLKTITFSDILKFGLHIS